MVTRPARTDFLLAQVQNVSFYVVGFFTITMVGYYIML